MCTIPFFTVHTWTLWGTTQLLPGVKKLLCGGAVGMDSRAGKAQADSDVWWMLRCHTAHRDWGLFVATNGIAHIFYCNPWVKPKNRGSLCVTGYLGFWYAHGRWGLRHCHTTKDKLALDMDRGVVQRQSFLHINDGESKTQGHGVLCISYKHINILRDTSLIY